MERFLALLTAVFAWVMIANLSYYTRKDSMCVYKHIHIW